jgi:hypothetical protein
MSVTSISDRIFAVLRQVTHESVHSLYKNNVVLSIVSLKKTQFSQLDISIHSLVVFNIFCLRI